MQLSKKEYARKRIHDSSSVQIENSVTRVTVRHHSANLVMPNSYPCDGISNQHLTTVKDSYIITPPCHIWDWEETADTSEQKYCPGAIVLLELPL